eukprot:2869207-Pyramimonas_sp.AAC.1
MAVGAKCMNDGKAEILLHHWSPTVLTHHAQKVPTLREGRPARGSSRPNPPAFPSSGMSAGWHSFSIQGFHVGSP